MVTVGRLQTFKPKAPELWNRRPRRAGLRLAEGPCLPLRSDRWSSNRSRGAAPSRRAFSVGIPCRAMLVLGAKALANRFLGILLNTPTLVLLLPKGENGITRGANYPDLGSRRKRAQPPERRNCASQSRTQLRKGGHHGFLCGVQLASLSSQRPQHPKFQAPV